MDKRETDKATGRADGSAFYEKEIAHRDETIAEYRDIAFQQKEWLVTFKANETALLAEREKAQTEARQLRALWLEAETRERAVTAERDALRAALARHVKRDAAVKARAHSKPSHPANRCAFCLGHYADRAALAGKAGA